MPMSAPLRDWLLDIGLFADTADAAPIPDSLQGMTLDHLIGLKSMEDMLPLCGGDLGLAWALFDQVQFVKGRGRLNVRIDNDTSSLDEVEYSGDQLQESGWQRTLPNFQEYQGKRSSDADDDEEFKTPWPEPRGKSVQTRPEEISSMNVNLRQQTTAGARNAQSPSVEKAQNSDAEDWRQLSRTHPDVDGPTLRAILEDVGGDMNFARRVLEARMHVVLDDNIPQPSLSSVQSITAAEKRRKRDAAIILKKLRATATHSEKESELLETTAEILAAPEALYSTYFEPEINAMHYATTDDFGPQELAAARLKMGPDNGEDFGKKMSSLWRVKLILTSLNLSSLQKLAGRAKAWHFGMVHAAVQIGPQILDWNTSSIVLPQKATDYHTRGTLLALDVGAMDAGAQFVTKDKLMNVCQVIHKWNASKVYSLLRCNCQDFVDDVFNALELEPPLTGDVRAFIESLSGGDESTTEFKWDGIVFKSHEALDEFVGNHARKLSTEAYALLKAFDRTFWVRYFALQNSTAEQTEDDVCLQKLSEPREEWDGGCPFENPRTTGTFCVPRGPR